MIPSRLRFVPLALLLLPCATLAATPEEYAARRAALADRLGPDAMLILMSPEPAQRNGDVDWPFRQEDNLLYLTGLTEPQTTLVLVPGEPEHREIVFTRDGTILSIGPDSNVSLAQFQFEPTTHEGNVLIALAKGSLRLVTGLIAKLRPEQVKVSTPTTVIGVRGTDFIVEQN